MRPINFNNLLKIYPHRGGIGRIDSFHYVHSVCVLFVSFIHVYYLSILIKYTFIMQLMDWTWERKLRCNKKKEKETNLQLNYYCDITNIFNSTL